MTGTAAPLVAYLGWHGRGNLGDDAIYDAVQSQLPEATFLDLPRFPHERMRAAATGLNRSLRCSTQVRGRRNARRAARLAAMGQPRSGTHQEERQLCNWCRR